MHDAVGVSASLDVARSVRNVLGKVWRGCPDTFFFGDNATRCSLHQENNCSVCSRSFVQRTMPSGVCIITHKSSHTHFPNIMHPFFGSPRRGPLNNILCMTGKKLWMNSRLEEGNCNKKERKRSRLRAQRERKLASVHGGGS